jgi:hypothetical protein
VSYQRPWQIFLQRHQNNITKRTFCLNPLKSFFCNLKHEGSLNLGIKTHSKTIKTALSIDDSCDRSLFSLDFAFKQFFQIIYSDFLKKKTYSPKVLISQDNV